MQAGALDFISTANQCPSDTKSAVGLLLLLCGANFLILVSADHLGAGGGLRDCLPFVLAQPLEAGIARTNADSSINLAGE